MAIFHTSTVLQEDLSGLVQTPGFPQAITISVIRSWKTQICNPGLLQSVAKIVLKLKRELWADTMLL